MRGQNRVMTIELLLFIRFIHIKLRISSIKSSLLDIFWEKKELFLIKKSLFLLYFVWLSDSHTKFLIKHTNSLKNWSTSLWFHTTCSRLFINLGWEWSLRITLVLQGRFLLGDTTKRLMSSPKCRSVEVINNPARPGSNHREINCINYK